MGTPIFNFLSSFHTVFHSDCTSWHSYQQYARVPFFHILVNTYFFPFLRIAILTGVRCCLIVVLIWILWLMLSTFAYIYWPFVCRLCRTVFSDPLPILKLDFFFFCYWVVWVNIFWLLTPYHTWFAIFFSISSLLFHFVHDLLCCAEDF